MAEARILSRRAFLLERAVRAQNPWEANPTCIYGVMVPHQYLLARFPGEMVTEFNRSPLVFRALEANKVIFLVIGRLGWVLGRRGLLVVVMVLCLCLTRR